MLYFSWCSCSSQAALEFHPENRQHRDSPGKLGEHVLGAVAFLHLQCAGGLAGKAVVFLEQCVLQTGEDTTLKSAAGGVFRLKKCCCHVVYSSF